MNASPSLLAGTGGEKRARVAALRFSHDNPRTGFSVGTDSQENCPEIPCTSPTPRETSLNLQEEAREYLGLGEDTVRPSGKVLTPMAP